MPKSARFIVFHTVNMSIENLIKIRNLLQTPEGKLLVNYLQDYITENACVSRDAHELKGMCELVQVLKNVPKEVEKKRK